MPRRGSRRAAVGEGEGRAVTWQRIDDEYPTQMCRRCDVAWFADDEADADERAFYRAPSGVVHIQRMTLNERSTYATANLIALAGHPVTYCGTRIGPRGK